MTEIRTVRDIIDTEYREYAMYVIKNRALPSFVDGLKPSTRKVLFTAIQKARNQIKTISLVGYTVSTANYHHGDDSLEGAIVTLAAPWANNAPLLDGEGSWGDRFDHTPSASRYTSVQLSKNFDKFFKDNDILEADIDPENKEPLYYLPLIPWVLVNGVSGVAVAYACDILPRKPADLVKAVEKVLNGQKVKETDLPPYFEAHEGQIRFNKDLGIYQMFGTFKQLNASELQITEIPMKYERAAYIKHLDALEDAGKIAFYKDKSNKNGFNFLIKFPRGGMPKNAEGINKMFNLVQNLNENLTVIDQNDQLKVYASASELLTDFVAFRLTKIAARLAYYIDRDEKRLLIMQRTYEFVKLAMKGIIDLKQKRSALIAHLVDAFFFPKEEAERVISMPMYSLCEDKVEELEAAMSELKVDIKKWKSTDPTETYLEDVEGIKL
jgi:DNA gyrase/topoisomerase IV subunit A